MNQTFRTRRTSRQFDIEGGAFDAPSDTPSRHAWIAAAAVTLALTGIMVGLLLRGEYTVASDPPCNRVADDLALVAQLMAQGETTQASVLAHTDLARSSLCSGVPRRLAHAAYDADVTDLLVTVHQAGDVVGEGAVIQQWHETVTFARQYYLTPRSPVSLEHLAYSLGYWDFARILWLQTHHSSQADRDHFYSVLVNDGYEFATAAPPRYRQRGLALLVLAHDLGRAWGLPRGEADRSLRKLIGPDMERWPKPFPSTLLPVRAPPLHGTDLPAARHHHGKG